MTDEIDTSAPERIWARVSPDWHDDESGEPFVGGFFDAGHFRDGTLYVRADLHEAERQRAEKVEAELERIALAAEKMAEAWDHAPTGSRNCPATAMMEEAVNAFRTALRQDEGDDE